MAHANATCYFPDGTPDALSQPCDPSAEFSHCCWSTHLCLSNGLCWDTGHNHIIRVTCTDPIWLSPDCPQYCKDDTSTTYGDMRECPGQDNVWMCGLDPTNCTDSFSLADGLIEDRREWSLDAIVALPTAYTALAAVSGGATAATVTTTVLATVTATSTSSAMPAPTASSEDATVAGLGAGLGVGLPLLAALGVSLFFLRRERRKNRRRSVQHDVRNELPGQPDSPRWYPKHEVDSKYIHEAPGSMP